MTGQQKDSPWEGAIRSAAAIWSPHLRTRQRVSHQLFHITDWLPTFAHLAGIQLDRPVDGVNIWPALSSNTDSPRTEILGHLDDDIGYAVLIADRWKYVNGTTYGGRHDQWLSGDDGSSSAETHPAFERYGKSVLSSIVGQTLSAFAISNDADNFEAADVEAHRDDARISCGNNKDDGLTMVQCLPLKGACLFDILTDPCERNNLAAKEANIVAEMEVILQEFRASVVRPRNRPSDERSNPKYFNGTWTWWYDELRLSDSGTEELQRNVGCLSSLTLSRWMFVWTELAVLLFNYFNVRY